MTDFNLSLGDLMLITGFKEAVQSADDTQLKRYLYQNGMDTNIDFELHTCLHRTLTGMAFHGPRYEGRERLDDKWIKSGYASLDAIIESTGDVEVRKDLRVMSYERNEYDNFIAKRY
jgi:hypothetical protein